MGHHPVEDSNRSDNTSINSVLEQHVSRRQILRGGATAATVVAGASLVACGGDSSNRSNGGDTGGEMPAELGFASVPRSLEDRVVLPDGYQASVLIAKGDALFSGITDYQNDGSGEDSTSVLVMSMTAWSSSAWAPTAPGIRMRQSVVCCA